jgi:hypothetical protein
MKSNHRPLGSSTLVLSSVSVLLITMLVQLVVRASSPNLLPPLPTLPPAAKGPPPRASIELHARFPQAWPWGTVHWQELWTVVQWQDAWGGWHDVEGWRGELDEVATGDEGEVVGHKTWWVAKSDLGTGPFRWLVYEGRQGRRLATSVPFDLPDTRGRTERVEVSLAP